jgi:molybdenum cofactor biosynthesis enzyme MoaA
MGPLPRYRDKPHSKKAPEVPLPLAIEVHPSPICQLSCSYCHSINPVEGVSIYGRGHLLTIAEYRTVFAALREHGVERCVISGGGEPFLYPNSLELIAAAHKSFNEVHIYSNGLSPLLRRAVSLERIVASMRSIRFSLHNDTIVNPRLRDTFAAAIHNIHVSAALNVMKPEISVSVLPTTISDMRAMVTLLDTISEKVDSIEIKALLVNRGGSAEVRGLASILETASAGTQAKVRWRDEANDYPMVPIQCWAFARSLVIDPYGNVRICCVRAHLPLTDVACIGHINELAPDLWVARAKQRQASIGLGKCHQCSERDRIFSSEYSPNAQNN